MNWYIARPFNMTAQNVLLNLLDHKHWKDQKNPTSIPSGLADWGFLTPSRSGSYKETDFGNVAKSAKWNWSEIVLHALTKRGSYESTVPVRPIVMMARALLKMGKGNLKNAYLTDRSFTRLTNLTTYDQLTDEFCEHLNDPAKSGEPKVLVYQDIWLNALELAGIFEKKGGKYFLRDDRWVSEFLCLLDSHGESISDCPLKDADAKKYYEYMGNISRGLPEILEKASHGFLSSMFPSYKAVGTSTRTTFVPQESINTLEGFVTALKKEIDDSKCGLRYEKSLLSRFVSALSAKPFVVLSGLSGSGKTKLAQLFVEWMKFKTVGDGLLLKGECFNSGAYVVSNSDALDYKILVTETGKIRTVSKNAVKLWITYLKNNPDKIGANPKEIRKTLQALDTLDDSYMHGSDAILNHIACGVLSRRDPFANGLIENFLLVPVGSDWTNSEKLLGYPNALDKDSYVMPDTGVMKLLMDAEKNPKLPFFLILDEMNLSHVERYFADFLSAMESGDEIKLYDGDQRYADEAKTIAVPRRIRVPKNLFVIGTMNVDETTYMFSPKVLDRAQVIEFRVKPDEMTKFTGFDENGVWNDGTAAKVDLEKLADPNGIGKGAKYAESFLELALGRGEKKPSAAVIPAAPAGRPVNPDEGKVPVQEVAKAINAFFTPLAKLGVEFGYRSASEIMSFCGFYIDAGAKIDDAIDAAIVQKLLPKVHGSRRKLERVLSEIWKLCLKPDETKELDAAAKSDGEYDFTKAKYPLSAEKVLRMFRAALANGFASFAEA